MMKFFIDLDSTKILSSPRLKGTSIFLSVLFRVMLLATMNFNLIRYSTKDWLHNLMTIRTSTLLKRIRGVVLVNTIWSSVIYLFQKFIGFNSPGSKAHGLLGGALGLLLVFRTNTAYNRYWEGRKIWERIVNALRDSSRFVMIYSDLLPSNQLQRILHLLIAFPIILQEYVQGIRHPERLQGLLSDTEIAEIDTVTNRPYFITNRLAKEVRLIPDSTMFTSRERERMYKFIDEMSHSISSCERIVQTPVPLPYARHTSRFLSLWCFTLPVCLANEIGAYVIPFSALVSWALFGIQEIGMMIEEPFQSEFGFKLEVFSSTIRRDISELVHVTHASLYPVNIDTPALRYEKPRRFQNPELIADTAAEITVVVTEPVYLLKDDGIPFGANSTIAATNSSTITDY